MNLINDLDYSLMGALNLINLTLIIIYIAVSFCDEKIIAVRRKILFIKGIAIYSIFYTCVGAKFSTELHSSIDEEGIYLAAMSMRLLTEILILMFLYFHYKKMENRYEDRKP